MSRMSSVAASAAGELEEMEWAAQAGAAEAKGLVAHRDSPALRRSGTETKTRLAGCNDMAQQIVMSSSVRTRW